MNEFKKKCIFSLRTNVMIALLLLTQQGYAGEFGTDMQIHLGGTKLLEFVQVI